MLRPKMTSLSNGFRNQHPTPPNPLPSYPIPSYPLPSYSLLSLFVLSHSIPFHSLTTPHNLAAQENEDSHAPQLS